MNRQRLEQIFENRIAECRETMGMKGKVYATDENRLSNFYAGAELAKLTPQQYAFSLVSKHIIALRDKINADEPMSDEFITEKMGDIINYMVLIEGLEREDKI